MFGLCFIKTRYYLSNNVVINIRPNYSIINDVITTQHNTAQHNTTQHAHYAEYMS